MFSRCQIKLLFLQEVFFRVSCTEETKPTWRALPTRVRTHTRYRATATQLDTQWIRDTQLPHCNAHYHRDTSHNLCQSQSPATPDSLFLVVPHTELESLGDPPAKILAGEGHASLLRLMVQDHAMRIDDVGKYGLTPLIAAVTKSQAAAVEVLLELGADLTVRDMSGHSATHYAMQIR